jgi:hypothetical protein
MPIVYAIYDIKKAPPKISRWSLIPMYYLIFERVILYVLKTFVNSFI